MQMSGDFRRPGRLLSRSGADSERRGCPEWLVWFLDTPQRHAGTGPTIINPTLAEPFLAATRWWPTVPWTGDDTEPFARRLHRTAYRILVPASIKKLLRWANLQPRATLLIYWKKLPKKKGQVEAVEIPVIGSNWQITDKGTPGNGDGIPDTCPQRGGHTASNRITKRGTPTVLSGVTVWPPTKSSTS